MAAKPTFSIEKLIRVKGNLKWEYVLYSATLEGAKKSVVALSKRDKNGRYAIVKTQNMGIYEEGKLIR
mgnify:CR=1 FL=1